MLNPALQHDIDLISTFPSPRPTSLFASSSPCTFADVWEDEYVRMPQLPACPTRCAVSRAERRRKWPARIRHCEHATAPSAACHHWFWTGGFLFGVQIAESFARCPSGHVRGSTLAVRLSSIWHCTRSSRGEGMTRRHRCMLDGMTDAIVAQ